MSLTKDEQKFWTRVKALAQNNLGQASYDFFIEPAKLLEITDHNAKIYLDNNMHRDFWKKQDDLIKTAGFEIFGAEISFALYSADDINLMKMLTRLQKRLTFKRRINWLAQNSKMV